MRQRTRHCKDDSLRDYLDTREGTCTVQQKENESSKRQKLKTIELILIILQRVTHTTTR